MKIVVIGGTGLIGSKIVAILRQGGHEVIAASPESGVNTITGEGLKEAMAGAQVVIDLANSPSFEDKAVLEFFETSGRNLLPAEAAAGVRHHVALSIVGIDRTDNGYFRAKVAQEKLIEASGVPYTIVRSTQFMEFLGGIANSSADGNMVRISPGLFQPIAADDVAAIVAEVALAAPRNGIVEIAGPERAPFNEIVARYLKAVGDPREVVSDPRPDTSAAGSRSVRSCRWAKRASAASVSTNGSAAHRQRPDPRILLSPNHERSQPCHTFGFLERRLFSPAAHCSTACAAQTAPQPIVVPIMQKDLADMPGKEMLMLWSSIRPELWSTSIGTMRTPSSTCWKGRSSSRSGAARRSP